jgi:mannosyltransferase
VVAAALAAALRWFRIDAQSLWYDEGISVHQLTRSFPDIVRAAALDTHPPLYYWTLKAWGETLGASELALRSLSATWGVVAVVATFFLGRRLFGPLVAVIAALLLAASPLAVYYSQEVRMYAQVTALALVAAYGYASGRYWLYALAALATLYSQYLGVAVLLAINLHALLFWRALAWRGWMRWGLANVVVAAGFLPWLPTFIEQQSHALNTSPRTLAGLAVDTATAYGGGLAEGDLFLAVGVLLVALALLAFAVSLTRFGARAAVLTPGVAGSGVAAATLAMVLWLAPLALVLLLGLRSGLFEIRYLVLSLPGLMLLAALAIVRLTRYPLVATVAAALLLVPSTLALQQQYFEPTLARDDYRGLVAAIEREARPTDVVVLSAPNQTEIFGYYYHGGLPAIGLPAQRPIDAADTRRRLDAIRGQYDRVWLVSWAMREADPGGVISGWLAENGFQATHAWYGSVQLALVGFGAADAPTHKVDAALDNGIVLDGYRLASRTLKPGETLALTLVWRAARGPTADRWKVFTHLLDSGSAVVAQRDAEPADNLRPTTSWRKGEQVEDNYGIAIPSTLPAGRYTLEIGMYAGERRSTFDGQSDHLVLGEVHIQP